MRIEILKKGDTVLNVTSGFVAVRHRNGEVDIIPITMDANCPRVDAAHITTIGYGDNAVLTTVDGVDVVKF